MTTVAESAVGDGGPLKAAFDAGIENLSRVEEVTFTAYNRLVLPLDGFVFWVRADQLSHSALMGAAAFNAFALNEPRVVAIPAATCVAKGSLHVITDNVQDKEASYSVQRLVFTSEQEVNDLTSIGPETMFIAEHGGQKYAFSQRGAFFEQAGVYHYVGTAVYPDLSTQVVDTPAELNLNSMVVSNSLPLWLKLNNYVPLYGFGNQFVRLFPSLLVPFNIKPPFASVHIEPDGTEALASAPLVDGTTGSQDQLCRDRVTITTYGLRNDLIQDFVACVMQYSLDTNNFGIANMPVPRDEKRGQPELGIIAQRKSIVFDVNYLQSRVRNMPLALIESAFATVIAPT